MYFRTNRFVYLQIGLVSVVGGAWLVRRMARQRVAFNGSGSKDAKATDPQLIRDFSVIKSYTAGRSKITYPGIRVF